MIKYFTIKGRVPFFKSELEKIRKRKISGSYNYIITKLQKRNALNDIYIGINIDNPEEFYTANDIERMKWIIYDSGRNVNDIFYFCTIDNFNEEFG